MANEEHLAILKKGVEAWSAWRNRNLELTPDLSGAFLSGANMRGADRRRAYLSGADLSGAFLLNADLRDANLREADLSEAELSNANLLGADLSRATLCKANLYGADFCEVNLSGADLTGASLIRTRFEATNLRAADLKEAQIGFTVLADLNLSLARGLDAVKHDGPSSISIDTIYRSKGRIPRVFLRRAGVPKGFITNMKSMVGKATEFYSCFISYSTKNEEFAKRLHADLQNKNVQCWFAPKDLRIGDKFRTKIDDAIL